MIFHRLTDCQNLVTFQEQYSCSLRIAVISVNKSFLLDKLMWVYLAEIVFAFKKEVP